MDCIHSGEAAYLSRREDSPKDNDTYAEDGSAADDIDAEDGSTEDVIDMEVGSERARSRYGGRW